MHCYKLEHLLRGLLATRYVLCNLMYFILYAFELAIILHLHVGHFDMCFNILLLLNSVVTCFMLIIFDIVNHVMYINKTKFPCLYVH